MGRGVDRETTSGVLWRGRCRGDSESSMALVVFETRPSPQSIPWAPEEEALVTSVLRDCLKDTDGPWEVLLTFSGVLAHTWVVECRRPGNGRGLQMLLDPRLPRDVSSLCTALGAWASAPVGRRSRPLRERPRPEE
jgi:hypothetical protein